MKAMCDGLFNAKIRDSGSQYSDDEYNRFAGQFERGFRVGTIDFTAQRVGVGILTKLTKILRESKHIRSFQFYGNLIRDYGMVVVLQLLLGNPSIVILDVGCNDLTNQSVSCLVDMITCTTITSLQLGATSIAWHHNKFNLQGMTELLDAVQSVQRIKCLGLSGLKLAARQGARRVSMAEPLAMLISTSQVLESISIANCGFTLKDMEIVTMQGLVKNKGLRFIDMHASPLNDKVGVDFMDSFHEITGLRYLNVSECSLKADAGKAIARSLEKGSLLIVLEIGTNALGSDGFAAIVEVLYTNQTLTELDISNNCIDVSAAPLLKKLCATNEVLDSLNVAGNHIGDECALAIAETIGSNESLTTLSIASCRITDKGAIAVATALVLNRTLRKLRISDNFLTRESGYKIIDILRKNEFLFVIDVTASQIDHFVIKATCDLCIRNRQIQKETDLQPLKKQLVRLSIQQTKMPEAKSRLQTLQRDLDDLVEQMISTECQTELAHSETSREMSQLTKAVREKKVMIDQEAWNIETIGKETVKLTEECTARYEETLANIEKEREAITRLEAEANKADGEILKIEEDGEVQNQELEKEIAELEALIVSTMEILKDEEQVHKYTPPDFEWMHEDDDPLFLVERLAMQARMKSSRSRASRSSIKSLK